MTDRVPFMGNLLSVYSSLIYRGQPVVGNNAEVDVSSPPGTATLCGVDPVDNSGRCFDSPLMVKTFILGTNIELSQEKGHDTTAVHTRD
jgi:hypothetical protein